MQFYNGNREAIARRIFEKYPNVTAVFEETNKPGYVLWMLEQIPLFDNQGKIDRWIGCVQGVVHTLGLFNWAELRDMTRQDLND